MKKLQIILIIILIVSCSRDNKPLEKDSVITEVFNTEETKELKFLLESFDNDLRAISNTENTEEAYHIFLENLRYNNSVEELHSKMSVLKPTVDYLLNFLEKSKVFESTFIVNYGFTPNTNFQDTVEIFWDPVYNGKYFQFLEKLSSVDSRLNDYNETVKASGSIAPSLLIAFPLIHKDFDLNKESNRLAIVFHYLFVLSQKDYEREPTANR
jgi:hypothetical protein